jgi:HK97 family phage prohead protease
MRKAKIINRRVEGKTVRLVLKTLDGQAARLKVADDGKWIIEGYASVFGNVDSYGEIVQRGAFTEWLKENLPRYPKLVWAHDWTLPLGPTLEAFEDDYGLFVRGELLPEVQKAVEAHALIKSGAITDLSFGFSVVQDEYDPKTGIRHLKKLAIYEWSPVLVGANNQAMLTGAKSAIEDVKTDGEFNVEDEGAADDGKAPAPAPEAAAPAAGEGGEGGEGAGSGAAGEGVTAPAPAPAGEGGEGQGTGADAPKAPEDAEKGIKAGRVLSAKTRSRLEAAVEAMRTATDAIEALLAEADAEDDGKGAPSPEKPAGAPRKEDETLKAIVRGVKRVDQQIGKILVRAKTIRE